MKVLVQWAWTGAPDWVQIDSSKWADLPAKPEPSAERQPVFDAEKRVIGFEGDPLDDKPGWLSTVHIMGMGFAGDHVAIQDHDDHIEVTQWNDDPGDFGASEFEAAVHRIYYEIVERQFLDNGNILTFHPAPLQEKTLYLTPQRKKWFVDQGIIPGYTNAGLWKVKTWDEFVPPPEAITRHGAWMTDDRHDAMRQAARTLPPPEPWDWWLSRG